MDTYGGGFLIIPTQLSSIIPYIPQTTKFFFISHMNFVRFVRHLEKKKHRTLFLLSSSPNIVGLFRLENVGTLGRVFEWYILPCTLKVQDRTKNGLQDNPCEGFPILPRESSVGFSIWWFQPTWRILVKLDHFPKDRGKNGKNKKSLKPPPSHWSLDLLHIVEATHIFPPSFFETCALDLPFSPTIPVANGGFGRDPRFKKCDVILVVTSHHP